MTIIRKNPNESLYPTGKKNIFTIIKNEASPEIIMWRVPYEDFNDGSKVIVAENEDALFYKNGVVESIFNAGEYSLKTENYPFLSRIRNFASGGISAYNCRIIYINKVHKLNNKWGTDGPIQVIDKVYDTPVNLIARGSYSVKIEDSKKFYLKYAGNNAKSLTSEDIANDMRSPVNQQLKSLIARIINSQDTEILGICSELEKLSNMVLGQLESVFEEYGVRIVNFYIEALEILEDDAYSTLKLARANAAARIIAAKGAKGEVDTLGQDYGRVKTADIMLAAATNPSSSTMGEGMGLGAGIAMGGIMGSSASSVLTPLNAPPIPENESKEPVDVRRFEINDDSIIIAPCGHHVNPDCKFCPECGKPVKLECPDCKAPYLFGAKFCSNCGVVLR